MQIEKRLCRMGDLYYWSAPKQMVDQGHLRVGAIYKLTVEEVGIDKRRKKKCNQKSMGGHQS